MRQMHINDIAHCWWESGLLHDQHLACESDTFLGTFYHSVSKWSFAK
jgi:hypothetical protein